MLRKRSNRGYHGEIKNAKKVIQLKGDDGDHHVHPQVREDAEEGGDEEDAQVLDATHFSVRDDVAAQADDDEEVEGGASDDRARSEVARLELVSADLNHRQHDFRRRRPQRRT